MSGPDEEVVGIVERGLTWGGVLSSECLGEVPWGGRLMALVTDDGERGEARVGRGDGGGGSSKPEVNWSVFISSAWNVTCRAY